VAAAESPVGAGRCGPEKKHSYEDLYQTESSDLSNTARPSRQCTQTVRRQQVIIVSAGLVNPGSTLANDAAAPSFKESPVDSSLQLLHLGPVV